MAQSKNTTRELRASGAQFVLLRAGSKVPSWRGWTHKRPSADTVAAHSGGVGLVPWSIGMTVADVDSGDAFDLLVSRPPLTVTETRRGVHIWYSDTRPRARSKFAAYGVCGDVIGATGYVRLHDPERAMSQLAQALPLAGGQLNLFPAAELTVPPSERPPEARLCHAVSRWLLEAQRAGRFNRCEPAELLEAIAAEALKLNADAGADASALERVALRHGGRAVAALRAFRERQSSKARRPRPVGRALKVTIVELAGLGHNPSAIARMAGCQRAYVYRILRAAGFMGLS